MTFQMVPLFLNQAPARKKDGLWHDVSEHFLLVSPPPHKCKTHNHIAHTSVKELLPHAQELLIAISFS